MNFKRDFEQSIKPGMKLTKETFLNIFACSIYDPAYSDKVLRKLEVVGYKDVRIQYHKIVEEWEKENDEMMSRVAKDYREHCEKMMSRAARRNENKTVASRQRGDRNGFKQQRRTLFRGLPQDW